jgi:hypothetical protein
LEGAAGKSSQEVQEAIETAAYALHFLYATGQLKAFREYLSDVKEPASNGGSVEQEFTVMEEAITWLHSTPAPTPETRVRIAGKRYAVWRHEGALRLVPAPSPGELEE